MPGDATITTSAAHRTLFVATICAGSFLLFLVQPMIARMALPRLGGAPAVWNSAMLVYQALLLSGYAYAHWLGQFTPRQQSRIHLALFAAAALMLPIGLSGGAWAAGLDPVIGVPALLLVSIGPLFFVVSAQAPLIQRWFALGGGDPYPLYAASNIGSFAGLIAYPFLVEPLMAVAAQRWLWSGGYLALIALVLLCSRALPERVLSAITPEQGEALGWRRYLRWVLLAAVPSGLMLSTTLHLTTDIVAMPLLWVMPLGLYLLSFSIAFAENQRLAWISSRAAPFLLLIGASIVFLNTTRWPVSATMFSLALLLVVSVALHGRLFADRPHPVSLTNFYLAMSVGGVLGGVLCALIAPVVFNWGYEHPLLLLAAAVLIAQRPIEAIEEAMPFNRVAERLVPLVALALSMLAAGLIVEPVPQWLLIGCAGLIFAIGLRTIGYRGAYAVTLVALMLTMGGWMRMELSTEPGVLTRSYFGVYSVRDRGPDRRHLVHGTTIHGVQNRGSEARERMPTTYYAPLSGVGLALDAAPRLFGPRARIGIVGLGTGTLACYARSGQRWTIYEIDPVIVEIARDSNRFTFLKRCLPGARIVLGDARIMLEREPATSADLIVIDAFSSDAVPVHLMTTEAFASYRRHVNPDGLVMMHISNRYLDLERVVAAAAKKGWHARIREYVPGKDERALNYTASSWVAMSPSRATIDTLVASRPDAGWRPLRAAQGFAAWTDDHASILTIVRLKRN